MAAPAPTLFDEITDFLLSQPSPDEVIAYKVSDSLDQRLHTLLDKNASGQISAEEQQELDTFIQFGHILTLLKAKARLKLSDN